MIQRLVLTLSIWFLTAWLPGAEPAAALDGTWASVAAQRDGKPAPDIKGHLLRFQAGKFTITQKDKLLYEGTYTTDAKASPPAIDFVHTAGSAKGKTWKGIYALEKDSLKICDNAPDPAGPRPKELASTKGYTCVAFQRTAPK